MRQLATHGLRDSDGCDSGCDPAVGLATLAAAEHTVLMVASILPEGEQRMRSLAERATEAAGERLALFQPPSDSPEERP